MAFEYSQYFSELKDEGKERYEDKMKIVGCGKDLYCYLESKDNIADIIEWTDWPWPWVKLVALWKPRNSQ